MTTDSDWPRLTADVPGCGGGFKLVPEDFEVEELPAYQPSGEGEHLYLWLEKRGRDTREVVRALSQVLGVSEDDVGVAGMKDRQAVTRQLISVPARAEPKLGDFALEGVQVLWSRRHGNKLRTGHLKGNRFRLRLRGVRDVGAARESFTRLSAGGVPNYFGEQRFGRAGDNADLGRLLVLGQRLPKRPERFQRKLYLSAFQSRIFNRALADRVRAGTLSTALLGDVLRKEETGGLFVCEAPEVDGPRVAAFEVSPAGPLFGPKMTASAGEVAEVEARLLAGEGVTLDDFKRGGGETEGGRRPYRVRLGSPELTPEGEDLWLTFELPRGAYATEVLHELLKDD
ncbi:tRNA pseudouridine(13) synthase TruD [Myxococcus sp. MISCRS1]|uniref:tRNA pseudouridine(13) synthase TruD n=1 Tax=Myxococcus TaxID=32 RepID=UPI001141299C|nr:MULTISPECIES: tRNA pseudouridine(13) synthase TruD [unclassified Myxococcus]MBZ4395091.1 tRNA pseudouridine(13) synthase TruD [Myxococcus sp. AS-1-15]MBZ4406885.1 tRNA pseudouridine(13) synthase TruD [Myxococcus sp. XM-1-1-1]MCK8504042.1 tRNA pseudouridine(13) synthase TruD [Myxococcus fulvus]BDT36352.1 tRNA pseudouridine(13) synthase TruD [Myxococcus sp. MH1]MCY1002074.1 tRNA pseudouridine(13) synthase TruD [Myxococcus sp. MISCRS1]